ncbi:MAG: deoxyribose-phosphate aldolase [Tannerellaceae bacterium]|nr:deoxyribose-phosphate aldolase [Tannerellaceae bacterium]
MDKYQEAFSKFAPVGTDLEITKKVKKLIENEAKNNQNTEVLKLIHGCIDLTSLTSTDTKESIWNLVNTVNDYEGSADIPNVAAICTYPLFADTVKQALTAQDVKIAVVSASFPSSQTFTEVKIAETSLAVMDGAEEIDVVLNLGYFLEGNYQELTGELQEIKASCKDAKLKVILETGALKTEENIRKASILSIYSGADFIKTSTGKEFPGATPEAFYIMCQVIKNYFTLTGNKIGIKASGGIRKAEDAVIYYTIVKEVLGEEWLTKDLFRIGASALVTDLQSRIEQSI